MILYLFESNLPVVNDKKGFEYIDDIIIARKKKKLLEADLP